MQRIMKRQIFRLLGIAVFSGTVLAQPGSVFANALTGYEYSALPDGGVQFRFDLDGPGVVPQSFSIDKPARIVLDFPGIANELTERSRNLDAGIVRNITAVQAGDRTRVVMSLADLVSHEVRAEGNSTYVRLSAVPMASGVVSSRSDGAATGSRITDIDFARGPGGEGRLLVTMSDPSVAIDTRQEGGNVVVEFIETAIGDALGRRLDVVDFGTPVQTIEITSGERGVRMELDARGDYEQIAYQTDRLYTIELKPLTPEEDELAQRRRRGYTGERLSLNFQDIEVRAVLQLLADFTGKNLVASDTVRGNVTLRLKNVPWDQALDIILSTKGLAKREEGNVMWVAPAEEIAARERLELETQQQLEELAPLYTEYVAINFAKASEIASLLTSSENNMVTERGTVTIDDRTNTLIIRDTEEKLLDIRHLIETLDVPIRQVLIESRIVNASTDFSKNLGVRFGYSASEDPQSDRAVAISGSTNGTTQILNQETLEGDDRFQVDLPAGGLGGFAPSGLALAIAKLPFGNILELELTALEAEGRGEILSNPRVVTSNQQPALIEQGTEIAFQEASSSGATSTSFKKAVLSLSVTPQITPDDHIIMDLDVTKDAVGALVGGVPTIDTQQVSTQVIVENGETVVIGGIYEQTNTSGVTRTPFLGELPYVGRLFRNRTRTNDKSELLIFVTPKLLQEGIATL